MPTRNTKRNSRATHIVPEDPKAGRMDHSKELNAIAVAQHTNTQRIDAPILNRTTAYTNPSSGDQQVVPQPALAPANGQPAPAGAANNTQHTPLEPQKSQEACCLTDDDDHTRADDDENAVGCEEEEQQQLQLLQQQQQEQEDEDAAAVAAAAALTAAAAERAGQMSEEEEEDDEDDDPSVPRPRTGSEVGAEAMDSIIEDFREGAVRQRNKRKAAYDDARAAIVSEPNNSGATITSGGGGGNADTIGRNHPSKRTKHDTGANSRHKRNIDLYNNTAVGGLKTGGLLVNRNKSIKKDEQPSNGGGSGEGSNEPSGSQMAAMGGAAMDNGSDESGEECKSAQQPLLVKKDLEGESEDEDEDLEGDRTEDESPRKHRRGDERRVKEEKQQQQLEQQGNKIRSDVGTANNRAAFAQAPWLLMPPPPGIRGQPQHHPIVGNGSGRIQQQQANTAAVVAPAPADLQICASSLGSMHSFYTSAQHHFMAQMQEIMAVAMDHHTHAAVASLTNGAVGGAAASADILPAEDVTAISRACATALSIINNIGAAPGPDAAAAALFAAGGGVGNFIASVGTAGTTELMPPPPPPATALSTQLLGNLTTLPLPISLYLPLPGAACAPPHPLQRQLASGMDLALLHAAPAAATGGVTASAGANIAALPTGSVDADAINNNGDKTNIQKVLPLPPMMVPVVGGAGLIDPTAFPNGLPLAAMQLASFPLQLQMAAAAAAAAAGQGMPAHAGAAN